MTGFKVTARAFMDLKKINDATDKAEKRALQRQAFAVFSEAKSSLISGGKKNITSKPGDPPRGHQGLLKKHMRYAVETRDAVIGPERISGKPGQAPGTLEHGGEAEVAVEKYERGKRVKTGRKRRVRIAKRPFMGPALKRTQPRLSAIWRDSIRKR